MSASPTTPAPAPAAVRPKKKSRRTLIIVLSSLVVVVIAGAVFAASRNKEGGIPVTTEKAVVKTITQVVTATGKVQPEVEVKISPEVGGEIIAIPFKEGATVKKGEVLVKIKPDFYQAQVEQMEAALASAKASSVLSQARLTKAEQDFKQSQELYDKKLVSEADFTAARTNYDVAKADFDSSQAQIRRSDGSLSQARDSLGKTTLYAPMDGTISSLSSEVGERVIGGGQFAGTEIMRVADLGNMELRVQVNENDIVNVKIGDRAVINIDAYPNRKFAGAVSEISSSAQGSGSISQQAAQSVDVTNFLVKIKVTDRDAQLRPGMSATADIMTQTVENVVAVPIQSVTVRDQGGLTSEEFQKKKAADAQNKSGNVLDVAAERDAARRDREKLLHVVFLKDGNKVKMIKVETGIADNTYIEVKSGVKKGDEVVSGSYAAISRRLKDGAAVIIEKPKPEEKK